MSNIATPSDLKKLWAFAVVFVGNGKREEAEEIVEFVLTMASMTEVLADKAQTRKLFCVMHDVLKRKYHGTPRKRLPHPASALTYASMLKWIPWERREAYILYECMNFTYDEIAEIRGCAGGTIHSTINRARIALASCIDV